MQVDLPTLRAIANLHDQADFRMFRKLLTDVLTEETKRAITSNEHTDVARGRAQMAYWLCELIMTAKERASAMEIRNDRTSSPGRARSR